MPLLLNVLSSNIHQAHPHLMVFSLVSLPLCGMFFPRYLCGFSPSVRPPLHCDLFREVFSDCPVQTAHSAIPALIYFSSVYPEDSSVYPQCIHAYSLPQPQHYVWYAVGCQENGYGKSVRVTEGLVALKKPNNSISSSKHTPLTPRWTRPNCRGSAVAAGLERKWQLTFWEILPAY